MKKIGILGITGSIGHSALEVVAEHKGEFEIVFASCHRNYQKLFEIAEKFSIKSLILTDKNIKNRVPKLPNGTKIYFGEDELLRILDSSSANIVLNSVSGSSGLIYTIQSIKSGKDLALANKESLVMAGELINKLLKKSTSKLLPVDSEHSAIFQCIGNNPKKYIKNLYLTASGGPFLKKDLDDFDNITLKQTLSHPTWSMGQKITVDSSGMLNKALEVIEAHHLFKIAYKNIKTVIHPQSFIHSMVEFIDGSIISQMSRPSMKLPILYALTYPERIFSQSVKTEILKYRSLEFLRQVKKKV